MSFHSGLIILYNHNIYNVQPYHLKFINNIITTINQKVVSYVLVLINIRLLCVLGITLRI